jgi:hypothetical protein
MSFDPSSGSDLHGAPLPAHADSLNPLALTREDVAAMLAAYQTESRRPGQWLGVVIGIGGLFSAAVLIILGEHFHWPDALAPVFFIGGWSVLLLALFIVTRRERQLRERYRVECPACGEALLDRRSAQRGIARVELAITTGNCPSCGAHFLAP